MRIRLAQRSDVPAIGRVFAAATRAAFLAFTPGGRTSGGMGVDEMLSDRQAMLELAWDLWWGRWFAFVAELRGDVIGFSCGGAAQTPAATDEGAAGPGEDRIDGQIRGLYVLPAHQGSIVGRFLVSAVAGRLHQLGFGRVVSWALEENAFACEFHAALGGRRFAREEVPSYLLREVPPEPDPRPMIGFEWDDASSLVLRRRAGG